MARIKCKDQQKPQAVKPPKNLTGKTIVLPDGGKIRKGQKKLFAKCTQHQVEERIEAASILLGQRKKIGQIKGIFERDYGINYRQTVIYITRARERMAAEYGKTRVEFRNDSLGTYLAIIADSLSKPSDKIQAQRSIDDLLGLRIPSTVELPVKEDQSVVDTTPPPVLSNKRLRELIAWAESDRVNLIGNGTDTNGNGHDEPNGA